MWKLTFTYTALGLANRFSEYYELFLNRLAEAGVGIVSKSFSPGRAEVKVKTSEEEAEIRLYPRGADIEVKFNVKKAAERRTLEGLRTGLSVLQRVLGGDLTGAAFEAAEESIESALSGMSGHLASVIANAAKDVAEELKSREAYVSEERKEAENMLREVKARLLALKEEVEIAKEEGANVEGLVKRCERAGKLIEEAEGCITKRDYLAAKAKLEAARRLLDKVEGMLSQVF